MRKKLSVYFTFPFPDYVTIKPFLDSVSSDLVDYVELGIPVKNPYYDGPKIRTTHGSSMQHFKIDDMQKEIEELKNKGVKTYALTYLNSIEKDQELGIRNLKDSGKKARHNTINTLILYGYAHCRTLNKLNF